MKKTKIRSKYIKELVAENEDLSSKLEETTKDVIESMLNESVKNNLKKLISEADDSDSKEEEKETEETSTEETTPENNETNDTTETEGDENDFEEELPVGDEEGGEEFSMEDGNEENNTDDEEMWNSLEQYKDENGEYDLTGMDKENVIKVLKVMKDDDGVRVVKNENGSITLTDDETDKEYIIDIDGAYEDEDNEEFSFEDDDMNESTNLGYTDNYQKKTAMTTPSNNEPASSKSTYSMDDGVPTGTEKPFAGKGDNSPYTENVSEECEYEIVCDSDDTVNETMSTQEQGAYNRGVGMYHGNTNDKAAVGRNSHNGGSQVKGTGENSYSALEVENIKRKANAIFNENKQLKAIAEKIKNKLEESIVINNSLGKVIKLIAENTTTKEEKINIVKRFNNVKTINEGKELYDTISQELKSNKTATISNPINETLAESKNNIVETPMYNSDELTETVQLMRRIEKLGKKN